MVMHIWVRYVMQGNFIDENASQNTIRQGAQVESIKFRGVQGEIIKSEPQSPKWHGHKLAAIVMTPCHQCLMARVTSGPCSGMHFIFSPINYTPTESLHPPQAFLACPWLLPVWTCISQGHSSHPSQIPHASPHIKQNWLIFVCNVNTWLPYFVK